MRRLHRFLPLLLFLYGLLVFHGCAPRKAKTTVDRVYELDPSGKLYVHPQFEVKRPRSLAVLPFRSRVGEGRIMGSEALFLNLNSSRRRPTGLLAEEMRLAFHGQLAQLPFELVHPSHVDTRLRAAGLMSWEAINAVQPEQLRDLLGAEAVILGEVINFEYYYGLLYTQLAAGLRLEMICTITGQTLWRFKETRRNHTVRIALDPVSLVVGLFQAGFSLRAVNMARTMDEICREAVATIPPPE